MEDGFFYQWKKNDTALKLFHVLKSSVTARLGMHVLTLSPYPNYFGDWMIFPMEIAAKYNRFRECYLPQYFYMYWNTTHKYFGAHLWHSRTQWLAYTFMRCCKFSHCGLPNGEREFFISSATYSQVYWLIQMVINHESNFQLHSISWILI